MRFLNTIEEHALLEESEKFWIRSDAKVAAMVIEPNLMLKTLISNIEIVIDGRARGSLLIDYRKDYSENSEMANVKIIQNLDNKLFKSMLLYLLH